jgi:hypothetical protein
MFSPDPAHWGACPRHMLKWRTDYGAVSLPADFWTAEEAAVMAREYAACREVSPIHYVDEADDPVAAGFAAHAERLTLDGIDRTRPDWLVEAYRFAVDYVRPFAAACFPLVAPLQERCPDDCPRCGTWGSLWFTRDGYGSEDINDLLDHLRTAHGIPRGELLAVPTGIPAEEWRPDGGTDIVLVAYTDETED